MRRIPNLPHSSFITGYWYFLVNKRTVTFWLLFPFLRWAQDYASRAPGARAASSRREVMNYSQRGVANVPSACARETRQQDLLAAAVNTKRSRCAGGHLEVSVDITPTNTVPSPGQGAKTGEIMLIISGTEAWRYFNGGKTLNVTQAIVYLLKLVIRYLGRQTKTSECSMSDSLLGYCLDFNHCWFLD